MFLRQDVIFPSGGCAPLPSPRDYTGLQQVVTIRQCSDTASSEIRRAAFETGIEDTKVEEICQAAGVTKGTFYFHFAHKEDILLEMGVETATILNDTANRCVRADRGINDSLRTVLNALARNIKGTPPAAVSRALAEFRRPNRSAASYEGPAFAEAFEKIFVKAQEKGEVTSRIEPSEMAQILEALVVDSIMEWSQGRLSKLNQALYRRAAIVVAGLHPDITLPD